MKQGIETSDKRTYKNADWELDFYSRPILEPDGKKRWELLITTSPDISGREPFRWEKKCPASEVNSIWLTQALQEAIKTSLKMGLGSPLRLRCWRSSMKTMIKKAAEKVDLEVIESQRTYALKEWIIEREKNIYPNEVGYITGPFAPTQTRILNQPVPLPENIRGDKLSLASIPIGMLKEAEDWPMEFSGLLPVSPNQEENILIPGLLLFSEKRALAIAGWIGGLEPVKLSIENKQLLLEAGQDDRWLVTDLSKEEALQIKKNINESRDKANGFQFLAVQKSPEEKSFAGFWMLRDIPD